MKWSSAGKEIRDMTEVASELENMPELGWAWSYPVAAGISAALVAGLLMLFRRRKWL